MDYGPLHSFWCFAFERYNGMLGSMPNNIRSIESQLMKRFLSENQSLSLSFPTEYSEDFLPTFPSLSSTGSLAQTLSSDMPALDVEEQNQEWALDSISSSVQLPKYSSRCALNEDEQESLLCLYSKLYSEPVTEILHTCLSYTLNGKFFGTSKSRTASSSFVIAKWDVGISEHRAARIDKFYKHSLKVGSEYKVHLLCSLAWFKQHDKCSSFGKPASVWYADLFDRYDLVPVQYLVSRAVTVLDKLDNETVLFVCSCID